MQTLLNDRYQVIKTLGSGGFGETFLAEDIQMPSRRRCVVKQLRPIQNNSQIYQLVQERFQREAAILEELGGSIDQIPNLYAYFQSDGQFYLVQEYIEGNTLTTTLQKQGLFNESRIHEIVVSLLQILDFVHSKRIIHRDIKPDNIIWRQRDNKPVLIDFGAVRETMATVVNSQGNPTSSIVIGTPGYMPSEQAAGRAIYSSDLYSLGVTAIYLLTGKQPQELEIDSRTGEIIWYKHGLNLSPTMQAIIDKAIASHPRDRFSTAKEMLQALRSHSIPSMLKTPIPQPAATALSHTVPQQTISSSPINFKQPINQASGQKGILLGSFIIGGLIGTSVIIGLALNKQPQQVAQEPLTQKSASSKEQTLAVQEPVTQKSVLSNEQTLAPQKPLTQKSALSSEQILASEQAAEQTLRDYYSAINSRQYQTAWNQLSIQHQNNTKSHPNGLNSFTEWWEQVTQVEIQQLISQKTSNQTATVDSRLYYSMQSGRTISQSLRYFLVWDTSSQKWLINKIQKN